MAIKETHPWDKIGKDEEIFVLRAQDVSAGKTVLMWIVENYYGLPESKMREAFECAMRMKKHTPQKAPD